jgi:hypothetical protein
LFELVAANSFKNSLGPDAIVTSPQRVLGKQSGYRQEVDVLIAGTVAGLPITIAVECKHLSTPVGIEIVNAFIGKLIDIGADQGVLFSTSGFTKPALARASGSSTPKVHAQHVPFTTAPSARLRGPFTWQLEDTKLDALRCDNWIEIPQLPILELGTISHQARGVLLVENLETFERVAACGPVVDQWLCIYGEGRASRHLIDFLNLFESLPIAAWYDLDADGVKMVCDLSERTGRQVRTVGMSADLWQAAPKRPESSTQLQSSRQIVTNLVGKCRDQLLDLATAIAETGEGCEQGQFHHHILASSGGRSI